MEEDNTQYWDDQWNVEDVKKYQKLYDSLFVKISNLLEKELIKEGTNGITRLPKEFKDIKDDIKHTK